MILGVDLAARFSAGIVLGRDGEIHLQFDSWGRAQTETAMLIAEFAKAMEPDLILIEDVPYGISKQFMVKPVLRLQGMVITELTRAGMEDRTLFVAPATWQRDQGVWKASPSAVAEVATGKGYTPPDLLAVHASSIPPKAQRGAEGAAEQAKARTKALSTLRKATTDYVDAFLICDWATRFTPEQIAAKQGVQPISEGNTTWLSRSPQSIP